MRTVEQIDADLLAAKLDLARQQGRQDIIDGIAKAQEPQVLSLDQFDALEGKARAQFIARGGKVVD